MFNKCLDGDIERYDTENRGKGIEPELCLLIVVHLQGLELHIGQNAVECVDHPRTERLEEYTEKNGHDGNGEECKSTLRPSHVAGLDTIGMIAKLTLSPALPSHELHWQIPKDTLKEITVHVGVETDDDVEETFEDSEYPVGERTFCTKHHAEHAKNGRDGCNAILPAKLAFYEERRQGEQHDASHEYNLECVEGGKTLFYHLRIVSYFHFERKIKNYSLKKRRN